MTASEPWKRLEKVASGVFVALAFTWEYLSGYVCEHLEQWATRRHEMLPPPTQMLLDFEHWFRVTLHLSSPVGMLPSLWCMIGAISVRSRRLRLVLIACAFVALLADYAFVLGLTLVLPRAR